MKSLRFLVMAAMCLPLLALAADVDYSRVINLAGKQRMLTQKMSKEVGLVALEVDTAANLGNLKATHDLFDKTLKGLRNGDDSLGLPPTKKPKLVECLDTVDGLWAGFSPIVASVIEAGAADADQIEYVSTSNVPLLKAMNKCVKLYESASTSENLNPALATAINLAGRQRMLTQKMSKEYFLVAKGHNAEENKGNLANTISLFDSSLNGLINGDASLGLSPAPTEEISAQLGKVKSMWDSFKAKLEGDDVSAVAAENLPLLKEMNKAVGMFEALGQS